MQRDRTLAVIGGKLDTLTLRVADIGEIAKTLLERGRQVHDVVAADGMEGAGLPAEDSPVVGQDMLAAKAGLVSCRHHLLEIGIGDKESGEDAGLKRIGAAKLQRRRRAVGLGEGARRPSGPA